MENQILQDELILSKIYEIRGQKVMLDRDLAELYQVETKHLKQSVRRNIERFPKDFMFVLTDIEYTNLRSQFVTSSWGGTRYSPMAFTEQGVAMLSSVLRSDVAIAVNIQIIRLFTKIRAVLMDQSNMKLTLEEMKAKVEEHDQKLDQVFRYLRSFHKTNSEERKKIGFKK